MNCRRAAWVLLVLLLLAGPGLAADDDDSNPHRMKGPEDDSGCGFCHEEDLSLTQSPLDTCLTCHSETEHAGAVEHLRAKGSPAGVADLPLTEEREIWCGTCHLFHDPQVNEEALLADPWLPADVGLPAAVRAAVAGGWDALAAQHGEKLPVASFATSGTAWLRLPVSDGALCVACHPGMKK